LNQASKGNRNLDFLSMVRSFKIWGKIINKYLTHGIYILMEVSYKNLIIDLVLV